MTAEIEEKSTNKLASPSGADQDLKEPDCLRDVHTDLSSSTFLPLNLLFVIAIICNCIVVISFS